jgi:hypothetical protein
MMVPFFSSPGGGGAEHSEAEGARLRSRLLVVRKTSTVASSPSPGFAGYTGRIGMPIRPDPLREPGYA